MSALAAAVAAAFAASVISGVAGFGGAMVFLPFLVHLYGAKAAVPILTVAVLLGNASRVVIFRRHIDRRVVLLFWAGAVPLAVLGSRLYAVLPGPLLKKAIGAFLIASVVWQRLRRPLVLQDARVFAPLGAASGFISSLVGGTGPISAPFFLAYGLAKESFIGTDALCAAGMHLTKALAYGGFGVMDSAQLQAGLLFGGVMWCGSYAAKAILERLPRALFLRLVEVLLVLVGLLMLFGG